MKKLAMIGCGGIGEYHLGHFLDYNDVEIAGFCDIILERAENFAKKTKTAKAFDNYLDMYNEIKPDMVFICIPPDQHGDIEKETIKRNIPFFVEKPLALNMELANELNNLVEKAGLITASGFQCRYSGLVEPNLEFLKKNKVVFINCNRMGSIPEVPWWKIKSQSGGQLVEQTIHQLDIIRYVFGEPDTVFSMATRGFVKEEGYDTDDVSTTLVKFKNGALATIATGCYATTGESFKSNITFSAPTCRAELHILGNFTVFGVQDTTKEDENGLIVKGDGTLKSSGASEQVYNENLDAGVLCDRTFVDAVLSGDGSKIRSPYADALKSVAFGLACNESMDTGLPVKLTY